MNKPTEQVNDQPDALKKPVIGETSFYQDIQTALAFLSRLPVKSADDFSLASASRAFGVAGLILGSMVGLVFWLATLTGLTVVPAVMVALAAGTLITGGLHEDGLADVADGFGGGWTKQRKLEIMRDSSIGTYGVLALIFSVALRIAGYSAIIEAGDNLFLAIGLFAAVAGISRAAMAVMMYQLPLARDDGRAAQAGRPSHDNLRQGLFISVIASGLVLMVVLEPVAMLVSIAGVIVAYLIVKHTARLQIGGYTGDVLGALQQIAEIFAVLAILAVI